MLSKIVTPGTLVLESSAGVGEADGDPVGAAVGVLVGDEVGEPVGEAEAFAAVTVTEAANFAVLGGKQTVSLQT